MKTLTILAFLSSHLLAQDCDAILGGDYAPSMNGAQSVEAAAQSVIRHGAEVRVRAITRMSTPTLEAYEMQVERSCTSWQSVNGGRKNNLVAIFVSVLDHKTGIYYGSQWSGALNSRWPEIEAQSMNPRFKLEDFAGGLTAGLHGVEASIVESQQPPPIPRNSGDDFGLAGVPLAFGIVFVFFLATAGLALRDKWKQRREDLKQAKKAAASAQQKATDLVAECSTGIIYYDAAAKPEIKLLIDEAVHSFSEINITPKMTVEQIYAATESYNNVVVTLRTAKHKLRGEPEPEPERPTVSPASSTVRRTVTPSRKRGHKRIIYETVYPPTVYPIIINSPQSSGTHREFGCSTASSSTPDTSSSSWSSDSDPGGGSTSWDSSSSDSGSSSSDSGSSSSDSGSSGGGDTSW